MTDANRAGARVESLETLELKIARLLRSGVMFSGALMLFGWALLFRLEGNPFVTAQSYQSERLLSRVSILFQKLGSAPLFSETGRESLGLLVCYAGLALLISLPVVRVGMTALLFFRQRDRLLGWIAITVLTILALSFALGFEI